MNDHVSRLEYIGLELSNPATWQRFATATLGLQSVAPADSQTRLLAMDQKNYRISIEPGVDDDVAHLGWSVEREADLEAIAHRLTNAGVDVTRASKDQAAQRGATMMIRARDPSGLIAEIVVDATATASDPNPESEARFVTGELGVGHVALMTEHAAEMIRFYVDGLGLKLSDTIDLDLGPAGRCRATFLHAGPRHHALAIVPVAAPKRLHHLMLQLRDLDDVGRSHDRCLAQGVPVEMGLGRHTNDGMTSFYMGSPAGFLVELGWGGRIIDDDTWEVAHYDRPSRWGHQQPPAPVTP
jgi:2,3-dihydroxybiphenyl 1,2-dioxygenase